VEGGQGRQLDIFWRQLRALEFCDDGDDEDEEAQIISFTSYQESIRSSPKQSFVSKKWDQDGPFCAPSHALSTPTHLP
jgi:hypothetical protein